MMKKLNRKLADITAKITTIDNIDGMFFS